MPLSGRNAPLRRGAKSVSGRNGAVSVRCSPIAARAPAASRKLDASREEKLGVTTMADVALMSRRATSSRIAALTAGDMP
jgi:hypothetical protein